MDGRWHDGSRARSSNDGSVVDEVVATASSPRCVVIAGPTGAGKSALALDLAERFGGEIVNADSRQIYRYMDIGTAKPTAQERARVPHHVLDVADPDERFDAARYRELASAAVAGIAGRGRVPLIVGGSGLYLRALTRGLFAAPAAMPRLRRALEALEGRRAGTLHRWCARLDPDVAARVHSHDHVRLVRALEVLLATGETISVQQRRHGFADPVVARLYLVVDPGVESLKQRIESRTRALFERGLIEEVRALWQRGYGPQLAAMRSIGYLEAGRVLAAERSREEAVADVMRATLRFAKRQRTWFRAERDVRWVHPDSDRRRIAEEIAAFLDVPRPAAL